MQQKFIDRFNTLEKITTNDDKAVRQQRGRDFEALINDILTEEKVLLRKSYYTDDNSREQIDGAIEVWNRVLLIEVKWVTGDLAASELYSFIGKVENKFHGSLGVFISRKELTENFIRSLNTGRRQNVIVIHGSDIDEIFKVDTPPISDYIEFCIKLLSYDNITHYPYCEFVKGYITPSELAKDQQNTELEFITGYLNNEEKVLFANLKYVYDALDLDIKKRIYRYVFDNLDSITLSQQHNFSSYLLSNYRQYIGMLTSDSIEIIGTEDDYFNSKLLDSVEIYGKELFNIYLPSYSSRPVAIKHYFEKSLVSLLKYAGSTNSWIRENLITNIVSQLWDEFQEATIDTLKEIYIDIYIDNSRLDKFEQKQFSISLIHDNRITKDELMVWLQSKLKSFLADKHEINKEVLNIFLMSYSKLAKPLEFDKDKYEYFVKEMGEYILANTPHQSYLDLNKLLGKDESDSNGLSISPSNLLD